MAKTKITPKEDIKDFVWTSVSQITLPSSVIEIGGEFYTAGNLVFDFANGTGNNGLDTGAETSNRWYALYAVPLSSTAYMLKASANLPAEAGGSGPSGFSEYRYLGLFRNGDNAGAGSDILRFVKSRDSFGFNNITTGAGVVPYTGGLILYNATSTSSSYSATSGMSATDLPFSRSNYLFAVAANYQMSPATERSSMRVTVGGSMSLAVGVSNIDSASCGGLIASVIDTTAVTAVTQNWSGVAPNVNHVIALKFWIDPILK